MPTTIRAPPNSNSRRLNLRHRLSISDRIRDIAPLQGRDNLLPRLAFFVIAVSEATVVVHETGQGEFGDEVVCESVEVHFLQRAPAVGHYQAGKFGGS